MNKEEMIRIAKEAGWTIGPATLLGLERFAALVAAYEREVCAKMCEESNTWDLYDPNGFAANLIRARSRNT